MLIFINKEENQKIMIVNLEGEVWKPIECAEGYFVSNKGRVHNGVRIIKGVPNSRTHLLQAMVYVQKKPKLLNVSRQVGLAFLPEKPSENACVRHKSKDLSDNTVENLEWGVNGGNKSKKRSVYTYVIRQLTTSGLPVAMYIGWEELERKGFKRSSIMSASRGNYRQGKPLEEQVYKHYRWKVERILNSKRK